MKQFLIKYDPRQKDPSCPNRELYFWLRNIPENCDIDIWDYYNKTLKIRIDVNKEQEVLFMLKFGHLIFQHEEI